MQNIAAHNVISFLSRHTVVDIHYHNCFQVVASVQSPFNCTIAGTAYNNMKGFIINQNVKHSCNARDTSVLVYFIDAESHLGWQLKEMLYGKPFLNIESLLSKHQLKELSERCNLASVEELRMVADNLLEKLLPSQAGKADKIIDERIVRLMNYIELHLDNPISLDDMARQIFLSPERARHLFVQETGSPFSQYLLWKRIKSVIVAVVNQHSSLVNAAIRFGFTDQAHFSRLFRRIFGTSAKPLLKNSRFVQFLSPEVQIALPL